MRYYFGIVTERLRKTILLIIKHSSMLRNVKANCGNINAKK